MTLKKVLLIIAIFVVAFIFCLFYTIRSTTKEVSEESPYAEMLHRELITKKETAIAKLLPYNYVKEPYSLTENTDFIEEKIAVLPKGTSITFTKAFSRYSGTAGNTYTVLIGIVKVKNKQYIVEWIWEKNNDWFGAGL
ncbi:MAG: hypothetical protein U5M51_04640 [Emticicia sp.]|nr:hypothetical protein [Emticicia sp.]